MPSGYSWPVYADLPAGGSDQLAAGRNAAGVYRCILLDAAWREYEERGELGAVGRLAAQADQYAVEDNPSLVAVTRHRDTFIGDLVVATQICEGLVGDLDH